MATRSKQPLLTSGEVSRLTQTPLQTQISWDLAGTLTAAAEGTGRAKRLYDEKGLVAALFARAASNMAFKGDRLAELIQLIQRAREKQLRSWAIYSYRQSPGLLAHDCGLFAKGVGRQVDWLRERDMLVVGPTDLWTVREGLVEFARGMISNRGSILNPNADL